MPMPMPDFDVCTYACMPLPHDLFYVELPFPHTSAEIRQVTRSVDQNGYKRHKPEIFSCRFVSPVPLASHTHRQYQLPDSLAR